MRNYMQCLEWSLFVINVPRSRDFDCILGQSDVLTQKYATVDRGPMSCELNESISQ